MCPSPGKLIISTCPITDLPFSYENLYKEIYYKKTNEVKEFN
ncbi:hypothetical protein CHCC20375_3265 [Bacillus licheniformis]|nr:hypothetical protein CHCC20375_3265 [Bacillus licheniformis]